MEQNLPVYKVEFNPEDNEKGFGLTAIGIVDEPAIMVDFIKLNKQQLFKVQNEEKRLLIAPALISGMRIFRRDEQTNEEYYVYFDKETIRQMVYYFFKNNLISKFNLNHNPDEFVDGVYIVESYFTTEHSQEKELGFNLPVGSWMITVKVDNNEVWEEYIQTGKLKGFSIEAFLKYVKVMNSKTPKQSTSEQEYFKLIDDIMNVLLEQ